VIYLDPAWLRREYLTWHRSLDDIAAQVGCPIQTLNRFARDHGILAAAQALGLWQAASTSKSTGSSAPGAGRLSTAGPALQAPRS
jgi:hypothetical protein